MASSSKKGESKKLAKGESKKARGQRRGRKRGPKARAERLGFISHGLRPEHHERHPVHVSMKRVRLGPSLREERVRNAIVRMIARAVERGVRVTQYSIQNDHLHLVVEADDKKTLARGLQWLFSRVAFAVNAMVKRSGSLFRDRHHRRALTTPTEVRRALVYVLFNSRKHDAVDIFASNDRFEHEMKTLDICSSAMWLDDRDWDPDPRFRPPRDQIASLRKKSGQDQSQSPLHRPTTWLGAIGWKRAGGALRLSESPRIVLR